MVEVETMSEEPAGEAAGCELVFEWVPGLHPLPVSVPGACLVDVACGSVLESLLILHASHAPIHLVTCVTENCVVPGYPCGWVLTAQECETSLSCTGSRQYNGTVSQHTRGNSEVCVFYGHYIFP